MHGRSRNVLSLVIVFLLSMIATAAVAATAREEVQGVALVSAETLQGAAVQSPSGTRVGTVAAVLIAVDSGRVGYVLIASENSPDRRIAVPWRAVRFGPGREIMLTVDAERFRQAPFEERDVVGPGSARAIHDYFGVSPHWQDAVDGSPRRPSPPRGLRIVR